MYNLTLLFFIILSFGTSIAVSIQRHRRQINLSANPRSYNQRHNAWLNAPSGSIPGTAYYGAGSDPNYGTFLSSGNSVNGGSGIAQISYDPNSRYFINSNQAQNYLPNTNNGWQSANINNNYQRPSNRYTPGSQGWYATGGNFWYNNAKCLVIYPCLLIINILLLIICQ
ncbi:hypothetical protein I4U23_003066 [Adineta vaga]|nr:hypothetical protein I4U23_003066 [Adineta vaga]